MPHFKALASRGPLKLHNRFDSNKQSTYIHWLRAKTTLLNHLFIWNVSHTCILQAIKNLNKLVYQLKRWRRDLINQRVTVKQMMASLCMTENLAGWEILTLDHDIPVRIFQSRDAVTFIPSKNSYSCKKKARPSKADWYAYLRQKVVIPYAAKCDCKGYVY